MNAASAPHILVVKKKKKVFVFPPDPQGATRARDGRRGSKIRDLDFCVVKSFKYYFYSLCALKKKQKKKTLYTFNKSTSYVICSKYD